MKRSTKTNEGYTLFKRYKQGKTVIQKNEYWIRLADILKVWPKVALAVNIRKEAIHK